MSKPYQDIDCEFRKPCNFDAQDPQFETFVEPQKEFCTAPKLKFFKNIRVSTNSVLFNYFKIVRESCINESAYERYSKGYNFFLKFIFPQFNFSRKKFLLITDEWTSNYHHWHVYPLAKLLFLQQQNLIKDSILILPKKYLKYPFVMPSLEKFGIKKEQLFLIRKKSNVKVKDLVFVDFPSRHPEVFKDLRECLTKEIKSDIDFGDKIYISRQGNPIRFVENEDEVVEMLEKYGFKKLVIDKYSYDEQVAIAAKARHMISVHGAGLTNIFFMSAGSSLLELAGKLHIVPPHYYRLADMLDIKYFYQQCEFGPNSQFKDFHHGSLVVDTKLLEKNLKLMLAHD